MSLKNKLLLIATIFFFLLCIGVITAFKNNQFLQRFHEEMEAIVFLQAQCNDIENLINDAIMAPHDYIIEEDQEKKDNLSKLFPSLKQKTHKLKQTLLLYSDKYPSDIFKSLLDSHQRVNALEKEIFKFEELIVDFLVQNQSDKTHDPMTFIKEIDLLGSNLKRNITSENTFYIDLINQNLTALQVREDSMYIRVQVLETFFFLIGFLLTFYIYRSIIKPVNRLLNVTRDISAGNISSRVEIKSADEFGELSRSFNSMLHELAITHEQMNSIFQGSGDAMRVIDKDFTVLQVNSTMADFLTIPPADNRDMKCYDQFYSKQCHSETCTLRQVINGKKRIQSETVKQTAGGNLIPVEMIATPLLIEGKTIGVIESFRDITERKKIEKEKEHLQAQLLHAQKLESVGQLAAGIAHEINTPTQYIGTNIDFINESIHEVNELMSRIQEIAKTAPKEIRNAIHEALEKSDWEYLTEEMLTAISQSQDGIKQVSSIVLAMKEFSHPGSKKKEPRDLNQIINTTITVAHNEWKYLSDIKLDLDPNLPNIPLLANEIGQVILNILVNAVHAIAEKLADNPDAEKGTITIRTKQLDRRIEIRISDTGNGIPEKVQSRIFEPFYTTKKFGKGTGQGLAISHNVIVKKHGGSIDFETELGKGTHFIIRLPL